MVNAPDLADARHGPGWRADLRCPHSNLFLFQHQANPLQGLNWARAVSGISPIPPARRIREVILGFRPLPVLEVAQRILKRLHETEHLGPNCTSSPFP